MSTIEEHFKKHKTKYLIAGGVIVGVAIGVVATCLVSKNVVITESFQLKLIDRSVHENTVTTVLARRGHPGNIIKCVETGEIFASQQRAAEVLGINSGEISKNVRGLIPSVGGLTFEKIREAA